MSRTTKVGQGSWLPCTEKTSGDGGGMGSRIVNILAIFAQLFDDIIHIPSLIKKSAFNPKIFALAIFQNRRFQG